MPIIVHAIRDGGARGNGSDDSPELQAALDRIEAAKGGTLLLEEPPVEYGIHKTLRIPKVPITIAGRGLHTAIVGRDLSKDEPVLTWKNSLGHVGHDFLLHDLTVRRNNSGHVVVYEASREKDRWKGKISNVKLKQSNNGSGTLLQLDRVLNCRIEGLILEGGSSGGIGLHLKDGSNAFVTQVVVMHKGQAPNGIQIEGGGQHHFVKVRTEGAGGAFSFKFVGVKGSIFESLKAEGDNERAVFHIINCQDLLFLAPGIGTPTGSSDPDGMLFADSKRCTVLRAIGGSMRGVGSGHCLVLDEHCEDISVEAFLRTDNAINEVEDRGGDNIRYDLQDAAGRRITSRGKRTTRRV